MMESKFNPPLRYVQVDGIPFRNFTLTSKLLDFLLPGHRRFLCADARRVPSLSLSPGLTLGTIVNASMPRVSSAIVSINVSMYVYCPTHSNVYLSSSNQLCSWTWNLVISIPIINNLIITLLWIFNWLVS